ncbi:MAG: recombinase family protein, partial [Pontixanthobacter sp.]
RNSNCRIALERTTVLWLEGHIMSVPAKRCAIYTRKSSEEGLDQTFNSLNAQREACEAYILSQTSEGWTALPVCYDDGGFSGGNIERPGLQSLLRDIEAGKVDIVVVYKIDRLTRSLADFARIVEIFEKADVSFVSVTQSFNTTSSMGRLMLNVLLSFAQFEREVTGERIRDKIAASKAKGMWMGGNLPLGYDRPKEGTHKLLVNEMEAENVRDIFARYLALGSVHSLERELPSRRIHSKRRKTLKGKIVGGTPFSRGALFHLLRNQIYLGRIVHKDQSFDGEHEAIVGQELFDGVQVKLDAQKRKVAASTDQRGVRAPLTGKLFDASGDPMTPTTSYGHTGRKYRYYVSAPLQQGRKSTSATKVERLSAPSIERIIAEAVGRWAPKTADAYSLVRSVNLGVQGLHIAIDADQAGSLSSRLYDGETITDRKRGQVTILLPLALPLRGGRRHITPAGRRSAQPDPVLIMALRKAHASLTYKSGLPLIQTAPASPYDRSILRLAFLAPDIQQAILDGRQPAGFNLQILKKIGIPLCWSKQRKTLGFSKHNLPCSAD